MSTLATSEAAPLRPVQAAARARDLDDQVPEFDALYRRYFRFTWSVLRRLGVPQASIEDAAQEVWVIVHRRLDALESPRAVRSWLFQIARRVAARHRRGEQRSRRKLDALGWVPARPDQPHADRDMLLTAETLLGQLDPRKREAFVLSELEGWSAPEIAKAAGTNPNTVYSRIRLAREELRAGWEARCPGADLDVALADLRESTRAPKGAAKRGWIALAPKLALGGKAAVAAGTSTGLGAVATWKLALAGVTLLGLATVGGTYIGERRSERTASERAARKDAAHERGGATEPVRAAAASTTAAPTSAVGLQPTATAPGFDAAVPPPSLAPGSDAAMPSSAVAPASAAPSADASATPTTTSRSRRAAATTPAAPSVDDDTGLLGAAQQSLAAGEPARALTQLAEHRERFAASPLADLRMLLEIKALCAAGRKADADAALRRAEATLPGSALLPKMRRACAP